MNVKVVGSSGQSYVWFKADGSYGQTCLSRKLSLKDMQELVGGYFELVSVQYLGETVDMWVNEEGIRLNLPLNHQASLIAGLPIVGDTFIIL